MSVYVIASLTIKDAVRFEDYRRMLLPTMAKYGARLVARGAWSRRESGGLRQNTPSQRRCAKPRLTRNW
jgi:uncharacterized protein (DUF1330 family)